MARGVELATAYVSITGETSLLSRDIAKAFGGGSKVALKAGRDMGKAVAKGYDQVEGPDFDKLRADAERADKAVAASAEAGAKARDRAAKQVEIAERRVQEVRERSIRQDAEVKAAEKELAAARKDGGADEITRAEKALADAREKAAPTSADLSAEARLEKARDDLRVTTQKTEGELKGYIDQQRRASEALGEAVNEAKEAETWTNKAGGAFEKMGGRVQAALKGDFKGAFKGVEREADNAADEIEKDFDEAGDNSGTSMLEGLKGPLLGAAGALGIGASFGELFQQGMASVSTKSRIKASLGLGDEDAAALGREAGAAYKAGFGEDKAAATNAAIDVQKYLGPDVDTEWATSMSLAMADAFGNDPQENIKAVAQLMRTGMVESAEEGFDVLTKGFQSGADKAGDLTDTMTEYGTLFRNLGIDGSTSVGLMSQGLNAGARDADKVADAFKEFSIRAVDGSEGTAAAFEALGLNADDMAQRIGKGGTSARDATQEVLEKLGGVEDPALRAQIAVGLFGTQAEDLGDSLYALDLNTASSDMGDVAGATETMADAVLEAQSPLDRIKRAFSDIGTEMGGGLIPALDVFADIVIGIGEFFRANPAVFGVLAAGLTAAGVAAFFASGAATTLFTSLKVGLASVPIIGWVIAGITLLVAALTWFFTKTELGQKIWAKVWGGIKAVFKGIMDWFTGTVVPLFQTIWGILFEGDFKGGSALEEDSPVVGALFAIRDAAIAVGEWVRDTLVPWLVEAWQKISDGAVWLYENGIKPAWDGISEAVRVVVDWIVNTAIPWLVDAWEWVSEAAVAVYEDAIKPAWDGISDAIGAVVEWVTGTLVPWLGSAWDAIAGAVTWLYESIIKPIWDGIRIFIAIAVTAILALVDLFVWYYRNVLAPVFTWLYETIVKPVWDAIMAAIDAVVTWFRDTAWPALESAIQWVADAFNTLRDWLADAWAFIRDNIIAPVVDWFQNTAAPALAAVVEWVRQRFDDFKTGLGIIWGWVKSSIIEPVVNWFRDVVAPLFGTVIGWIRAYFENLKLGLQLIWGWIKDRVINPVVAWFRDFVAPLFQRVVDAIKQYFENLKNNLQRIWGFIRDNVINPVVAWFRDTAWPTLRNVIDSIRDGFQRMRDKLSEIWNAVKDKIISPVVQWITVDAKGKLDTFVDKVETGFTNLKDSVLEAWEKIKEGMKEPINGVIGIYNKHIADNFNKVIDTIFGEEDAKKYKVGHMAEFARGGWTGPGSKYQEAGIVHADEFVIRKESQRDLRANAPGFLDSLNRYGSRALGYASGGLVKLRMPFSGNYPRGDGFGARGGRHKGIDWPIPSGTVLNAVAPGTVGQTWNPAAGRKVELSIGNGLVAGYHHLSGYATREGAKVGAGGAVGYVGSTGRSSGPHLHFSLKRDGKYVDPAPYLGAGGAAGSGDDSAWWNPFDGLWSKIKGAVSGAVGGGVFGDMLSRITENTVGGIGGWVTDKIAAIGDWASGQIDDAKANVGAARWSPVATMALNMKGQSLSNLPALLRRMNQESGYNPRAINTWDSNAKRGTPSKGLMQVIDPTFRRYAEPGYDRDIYDPLSNILASINYTLATYGSLKAGWNRRGGYADGGLVGGIYDNGGWLKPGQIAMNLSNRPEPVFSGAQWDVMEKAVESGSVERQGNSGATYHITVPADPAEDRTTVARRIGEVLDFRELNRRAGL